MKSLESALQKGPSSARITLQNCMIMRKAVETYYNLAVSKNAYLLTIYSLNHPPFTRHSVSVSELRDLGVHEALIRYDWGLFDG